MHAVTESSYFGLWINTKDREMFFLAFCTKWNIISPWICLPSYLESDDYKHSEKTRKANVSGAREKVDSVMIRFGGSGVEAAAHMLRYTFNIMVYCDVIPTNFHNMWKRIAKFCTPKNAKKNQQQANIWNFAVGQDII